MNIEKIINAVFQNDSEISGSSAIDGFNSLAENRNSICRSLNSAFIISLSGNNHTEFTNANGYLQRMQKDKTYGSLAQFLSRGLKLIADEIEKRVNTDTDFASRLSELSKFSESNTDFSSVEAMDALWSVFFPEAEGVFTNKEQKSKELRKRRTVKITKVNPKPITDPGKQIIFTSNILLTVPDKKTDLSSLGYSEELIKGITLAVSEKQSFYYDHPIQIGTKPETNEIIYGLNGLNRTAEYEMKNGNMDTDQKLTCILSASVTHKGLQKIAKKYIKEELNCYGNFDHLDVYVFTEEDTEKLIDEIFLPIADNMNIQNREELLKNVFGVDGEYGRHYSFLKAITAFWNVLVDADKTATFKIDLDQFFPQDVLKVQSGKSAFEHFQTPLWGAEGIDSFGNKIELGMIAGALVNEKDIHKGLFTPDVVFDNRQDLKLEERFFYSKLMMGLSTSSELATRYGKDNIDGKDSCIQRIHVTGGTNGILVKALRKHRPFTPGFIGRAEDQAYLLSVLGKKSTGLAYLHEDGLIMRHDKEAFAGDAMKAASAGNMIGDFIRILYFSRYSEILTDNILDIKETIDPFTGCFVSKIPITTVLLRFCMKAADFFESGNNQLAADFMLQSFERLERSIEFAYGKEDLLQKVYKKDREGWNLFYDILDGLENRDIVNPVKKMAIQIKAAGICAGCKM
ncbi:MAG: hypothetical protein PF693_16100 [Spirochaetia bacterium]|jgi:hypothetical protein|nr:hypothetical protein [Spirochaetia bacterium]